MNFLWVVSKALYWLRTAFERRRSRRSGVLIGDIGHVSHFPLALLLLTLDQ